MTQIHEDATRICTDHGVRLTPQRARVLELLREASRPLKAYDLLPALGAPGRPAKPPTAYRALDFLVEHGLAHRIESLNAYVACEHAGADHLATFLICDGCGLVTEVHFHEPVVGLASAAQRQGFNVDRVAIEAHGKCWSCRQAD